MNGFTQTQNQDLGFLGAVWLGVAVLAAVAFVQWAVDKFRTKP